MKSWVGDPELSLIQPKMQGCNIKVKVKVWMNQFPLWCIINSLLCYATAKADIKLADSIKAYHAEKFSSLHLLLISELFQMKQV